MRVLALVAMVVLAGCSGDKGAPAAVPDGPGDAPFVADAPAWQVGDWFGHHFYFGPEDTDGYHVDVMVTAADGTAYEVATDDQGLAKWEAVYDIPILGTIQKADLSTDGFGAPWVLYDFPIEDNKTWEGSISGADFETQVKVEFQATYNPSIMYTGGSAPGFDIVGTTADGLTIVQTDYLPTLGWYSEFRYFDITTEEPDDWFFRSISMGSGQNWTGTYYVDTAAKVLALDPHLVLDPAGPVAEPQPPTPFTVPESQYLIGYAYAWAAGGVSQMTLVDPTGERHDTQAMGTGSGFAYTDIDLTAVPGEWTAVPAHAGIASGAGAHLWAVTEGTGTL